MKKRANTLTGQGQKKREDFWTTEQIVGLYSFPIKLLKELKCPYLEFVDLF